MGVTVQHRQLERASRGIRYFLIHFALILLQLLYCQAHADSDALLVSLEPESGDATTVFQLEVRVRNNASTPPYFEHSEQFSFTSLGTSSNLQIINGVQTQETVYRFRLDISPSTSPGSYELPAGKIELNGKETSLTMPRLNLLSNAQAEKGNRPNVGVDFTQIVDNFEPYIGEQVIYRAEIAASQSFARASLSDITVNNCWRESFGKYQEQVRQLGNTSVHSILEGLFPTQPGEILIPERTLTADIRIPRVPQRSRRPWDMLDDMFGEDDPFLTFQTTSRKLIAKPITLHVKELPPPPFPNLGYIPVGDVKSTSSLDQTTIKQGESITLTLRLLADANLKPYELAPPSGKDVNDFKIYADKPQIDVTSSKNRLIFTKTFRIAFVPQKTGDLSLPGYRVVSFLPKEKKYITYETPPQTITVLPGNNEEKLIVKGSSAAQTVHPNTEENKEDIQILGEDLYPQHLGAETYKSRKQISRSTYFLLLIFLPLFSIGLRLFYQHKLLLSANPLRTRALNASKEAKLELERLQQEPTAEGYLSLLRIYLGDKLQIPGESLTSYDVKSRIYEKLPNESIASRCEGLFRRLQKLVYGGQNRAAELTSVHAEIQAIIHEIENKPIQH